MRKVNTPIPILVCFLGIFLSLQAYSQNRTVTGQVTDADSGEELPFVNVLIKGSSTGTTTDIDGTYSIEVPSSEATLLFSFIGFQPQEVVVGNRSIVDVSLQGALKQLDEVVVVGYGTQRKADITGSVGSVTREDFNVGQVTNAEQLITGKVAGVQITPNGGRPGSGGRIRIRGGSSLNATNDPLIVIDGVPLDNSGVSGTSNPLNFLNPNDIEAMDILKDASATAIYGSRASNGVILITTKKGKKGQPTRVSVSTLASVSQPTRLINVLDAEQFREAAMTHTTPQQQALMGDANTDWQREIYQNALAFDNNVSVSGAIRDMPFRVSAGYLHQDGILKTDNIERTTAGLSLSPSLFGDQLKVNLNLKGVHTKSRFADQGAIGAAVVFDPTQPVYDPEGIGGYWEWRNANGTPQTLAPRNPLGLLEQRDDLGEVQRSIGNLQLDYAIPFVTGLKANLNLGYDISQSSGRTYIPSTAAAGINEGGSIAVYEQYKQNLLSDFYFSYAGNFERYGRLDATLGYSFQDFLVKNPTFDRLNEAGDVLTPAGVETRPQNRLISYFGRVNYSLSDKYLLTATVRYDGSSRFSPETRWGVFPSLAAAWRISEEDILKDNTTLTDLKLRLGYGVTGQQDIGSFFPFLPRYTLSDDAARYRFGETYYTMLRPEGYDRNIKWEETVTYNAGLDFELFDGRGYGSLDYYFKRTNDLLAVIPVPAGTNLTNLLFTNVGNIENRGLEASFTYNIVRTPSFSWNLGANFTYNRNTIISLSNVEEDAVGILVGGISGGTGNTVQVHTVGFQPSSFFVWQQVYDQTGAPVENLYVDRNGDGIINEQDLFRDGFPDARYFFGINSKMKYKQWDLGFVLRGNLGAKAYNNVASANGAYQNLRFPDYLANMHASVLNTNFQTQRLRSNYYLEDASFLRMENISLGYNFGSLNQKGYTLQVNATVQNAFVITNYQGVDPEIPGGIDNNFYPLPRIVSLGLNLGF
ncbi:SusC, outer membrane protein involved in starch binding [Lunatimonas lonarensis]|uniref:SusC, outer membrane protein involved in starch binding n=1 Tax=Lunatimonas lonarensis TaxID=1232681 RepID=R7ZMU7_9BACT|nr:TonB-dependent receptor [Lunatimonas lonarensis]EON75425.1 SusC, outer membrane protein involved in starch binding [Lunatimonas lonarensis]